MSRETAATKRIALLATGDEVCNGDILNTNSQQIARRLVDNGMHTGLHMAVSDVISEIEQAIDFLLQSHSALIITGGLGPTSDDLTWFALSHSVDQPLVFDENIWQDIVARLKRFGYDTPPESNRQQALFPEGATIIQNPNGTAAGCMVKFAEQLIFMLPGPPVECMPMLDFVVENLKLAGLQEIDHHKNWLLFGVSEGQIAEELDALAKPYDCTTGYRLQYPYTEFKLHSKNKNDFEKLVPLVEKTVAPYLIDDGKKTASELLKTAVEKKSVNITICDRATLGLLQTTISTPDNYKNFHFSHNEDHADIIIDGLDEFWHGLDVPETSLDITIHDEKKHYKIPLRGSRVKIFAVEFICKSILDTI